MTNEPLIQREYCPLVLGGSMPIFPKREKAMLNMETPGRFGRTKLLASCHDVARKSFCNRSNHLIGDLFLYPDDAFAADFFAALKNV